MTATDGWEAVADSKHFPIVCAAVRILRRQPTITADDLHDELTPAEYPGDRRAFGAVLLALVRQGRLEKVGYTPSTRPECHARPILVYREVAR